MRGAKFLIPTFVASTKFQELAMALLEKQLFIKKSKLPNAGKGLFTKKASCVYGKM